MRPLLDDFIFGFIFLLFVSAVVIVLIEIGIVPLSLLGI